MWRGACGHSLLVHKAWSIYKSSLEVVGKDVDQGRAKEFNALHVAGTAQAAAASLVGVMQVTQNAGALRTEVQKILVQLRAQVGKDAAKSVLPGVLWNRTQDSLAMRACKR